MHSGFFIENQPQCSHLSSAKLFAGRRLPVLAVFGICLWSLLGAAPGAAAPRLSSTISDDLRALLDRFRSGARPSVIFSLRTR
jgi:hypothetical protein